MKDAYYFSHDSNARNDERVLSLRMKHGWSGYGLFWAIIEKMRESSDYQCIKDYNVIAFDLRVDTALIKSIVEDFGLFVFTKDGKYFYSIRLKISMGVVAEKSEKARAKVNKRWEKEREKKETDTTVLPQYYNSNTSKVNESKVKEKKEGNREKKQPDISPPDLSNSNLYRQPKIPLPEEVQMCFTQNGGTKEMADKFYEVNQSIGWFYKSSPITNFRNMVPGYIRAWNENEAKRPPPQIRKESKTMTQDEFLKTLDE